MSSSYQILTRGCRTPGSDLTRQRPLVLHGAALRGQCHPPREVPRCAHITRQRVEGLSALSFSSREDRCGGAFSV